MATFESRELIWLTKEAISHDQRRGFGGHINVQDEHHRFQLNAFALSAEEKLIVNGHVTLLRSQKGKGRRKRGEFKAVQGQN